MKPDMKPDMVREAVSSHVEAMNKALSDLHKVATGTVTVFPELEYAFKFDHPMGDGIWLNQYF